jgi:hypothetical protein
MSDPGGRLCQCSNGRKISRMMTVILSVLIRLRVERSVDLTGNA